MTDVSEVLAGARKAAATLASATTDQKNTALLAAADALVDATDTLLEANAKDIDYAKKAGRLDSFIDRLSLTADRIKGMANAIRKIAELPDPVGRVLHEVERPNGLLIKRVSVPIGVVAMVYEARPNVGADAGALCLKSGNTVILRGGSDSLNSAKVITGAMQTGLKAAGLPETAVQSILSPDRSIVNTLLTAVGEVDLVIPRGGKSLVKLVQEEARVPTLLHLEGNCHTYIHEKADIEKSLKVLANAKLRRPGICGATESLVVDRSVAKTVIPRLRATLPGTVIKGDGAACALDPALHRATKDDWGTEYLDKVISVRIVPGLKDAMDHIRQYSSGHTDAILTEDQMAADTFQAGIDSAIVMHNASTQFADGGEFGMGAEIGIATGKMHARGPVGLEQLTSFKYLVMGDGQTRPD